jgi:peptidase M15-like protein
MADVNYNGKTVSDENVQTVLGRVATELGKNVNVSSGDRGSALDVGAGTKSLHLKHRAADFHVEGLSDEEAFKKIQEKKDDIFDSDKRYEVIWHGPHTETMGQHVHIGRFETGTGVNFKKEGTTAETKGKYTVASGYAAVPSAALAMQRVNAARFPGAAISGTC